MNPLKSVNHLIAMLLASSVQAAGVDRDFTGDGTADVLLRNSSTGAWLLNSEAGSQTVTGLTPNLDWQSATITDLNGDGKADVLLRNQDGRWWGYLMDGATAISGSPVSLTSSLNWEFKGAGDFDGDGNGDILLRRSDTGSWYIYLMTGLSVKSSGPPTGIASNLGWEFKGVADFNGDTVDDILLRNVTNSAWFIYAMNGQSVLNDSGATGAARVTANPNWQFQAAADFNGDGTADILLRRTDGPWFLYPMDGINKITSSDFGLMPITANIAWQPSFIADSNGDGFPDVVLRNTETFSWYRYAFVGNIRDSLATGSMSLGTDSVWGEFFSSREYENPNDNDVLTLDDIQGNWVGEVVVAAGGESCTWSVRFSITGAIAYFTTTLVSDRSPTVDCITAESEANLSISQNDTVDVDIYYHSAPILLGPDDFELVLQENGNLRSEDSFSYLGVPAVRVSILTRQ